MAAYPRFEVHAAWKMARHWIVASRLQATEEESVVGVAKKAKHKAKVAKSKARKGAGKAKRKGKKVKTAAKH